MDYKNTQATNQEESNDGIPTIKEIALMHIRKISEICCQEFTKGYWEEKPVKVGGGISISKVYHPDTRSIFCNAIDFLVWIVYPYSNTTFKELVDGTKDKPRKEDDKLSVEEKIKDRMNIFRKMNVMFEEKDFFDTSETQDE